MTTTEQVKEMHKQWLQRRGAPPGMIEASDQIIDDWLNKVQAKVLRDFVGYIMTDSPRSWGYVHPCHPDEVWEPSDVDKTTEFIADLLIAKAEWLEGGKVGKIKPKEKA